MNPATDITNRPRNPWTGKDLPTLPHVNHPENWILRLEEDGELYRVYTDDEGPFSLAFTALANADGTVECAAVNWTGEPLDFNQLETDAMRLPEWVAEIRAVTQWTRAAFNSHETERKTGMAAHIERPRKQDEGSHRG